MIITIDGPAVSGKSTIAKELAHQLGIYYLQTGLLYRALTYALMQEYPRLSIPEIETRITAEHLKKLVATINYVYENDAPHIILGGKDVTPKLYDAALDNPSSVLSTHPDVRATLLGLQHAIARNHDLVTDGRDCGSVVFPHAEHKFFLTASMTERVTRFLKDKKRAQSDMTPQKAQALLEERDKRDTERTIAPLVVPLGATIIDNSGMSKAETIEKFLSLINKKR